MRASVVILLLLVTPAAGAQSSGSAAAQERIASCIAEASDDDVGLAALEASCPGIEHALTESGYVGFVSEWETERLTRGSLADLQDIANRYDRPVPALADQAGKDVASLEHILGELDEEQVGDRPLSWFERLERWLSGLLRKSDAQRDSWFSRWLRDVTVPERVSQSIVYASIALILVIALVVVVNELRAAGAFRRRGKRAASTSAGVGGTADFTDPTSRDLDAASLEERPSLLLRMLVTTLVSTGRLRTERSLTHGELVTRAKFDAVEQRRSFHRVASLCERILYGNGSLAPEEIDAVVRAGRALNEQLQAPRAVS